MQIIFWGFLISFLGSLPVGTLNVTVTNIYINTGLKDALQFSFGAIAVEVILVRLSLASIHKIEENIFFKKYANWISIIVLLCFASVTLLAAWQGKGFNEATILPNTNPIFFGAFLSLLNPLHLPFWMGWSAVLKSKNILQHQAKQYNIYMLAIALGTGLAFALYAFAGNTLIQYVNYKQHYINWAIGLALLATALLQLYKSLFQNKLAP